MDTLVLIGSIAAGIVIGEVVKAYLFALLALLKYRKMHRQQSVAVDRLRQMEQEYLVSQETATEAIEGAATQ